MFTRSEDDAHRLEDLVQHARAISIGTLVTYDALKSLTGIEQRQKLYDLVRLANKSLLPHKRLLVNVRHQGYKLAPAPEQMAHAKHRTAKGTRQLKWSLAEYQHTDELQLSSVQKVQLQQEIQLASMRLDSARRRTLQAREQSQKAVFASDRVLEDLAQIRKMLDNWKRNR